jgi:hypothetical protein
MTTTSGPGDSATFKVRKRNARYVSLHLDRIALLPAECLQLSRALRSLLYKVAGTKIYRVKYASE